MAETLDVSILDFLAKQPPLVSDALYCDPPSCLAVYLFVFHCRVVSVPRYLPPLCRHFTLRLLYVPAGVPKAVLASWLKDEKFVA